MKRYVAETSEARVLACDDGLYQGWTTGQLIDWLDELVIVVGPPRQEGRVWYIPVAPAKEVGREAGSA